MTTMIKTKSDAQVYLGLIPAGEPRDRSREHLSAEQEFDNEKFPEFVWIEKPVQQPDGRMGPKERRNYNATTESAEMLAGLLGAELVNSEDGIPTMVFPNTWEVYAGHMGEVYNDARRAQKARIDGWNQVGYDSHKNPDVTDPQTIAPDIITIKAIADEASTTGKPWPHYGRAD